ncbi:MAG: ribosome-associated translation inhibitor RaiA [Candidatus Omnitrophota bacterium]
MPIKLEITSRRHQLSEHLRDYVEEKILKLEKYAHGDCEAHVVFERSDDEQSVEVTVHGLHRTMHGKESGESVHACIDGAISKVETQIRKEKDKQIDTKI